MEVKTSLQRRVLIITCLANLFELYDFTLFAVLLPILVGHFFPASNYFNSIIIGYIAFAISFFILPFGSIFWGYIGDKFGSHKIFRFSLFLMALPSLTIAILPTYSQVGWIATILLLTLRLIQGLSASGEVLGAKIYAFDCLGKAHFLRASALISAFGAVGVLAAINVGAYISSNNHGSQLWRIPFAIGGSVLMIMTLIRLLNDTKRSKKTSNKNIEVFSIVKIVKENPRITFEGFILSGMLGIFSYFMHGFIINFQIVNLNYSLLNSYQNTRYGLIGTILFAILLTITHKLFRDNILALLKKVLLLSGLALVPLYLLLLIKNEIITIISFIFMGGLLGLFAAVSGVYVITSFSQAQRCRGALMVNAFGIAIFGGLTPLLMTIFAGINIYLPGIALGICPIICLLVLNMRKVQ